MDQRDVNGLRSSKEKKKGSTRGNSDQNSKAADAGGSPKNLAALAIEKCSEKEIILSDLVRELKGDLACSTNGITGKLIELKEGNRIRLVEKSPYLSLGQYIVSPYSLWFWAAILSTVISFALVIVTSGIVIYLRYVFASLLVLFLPGFSLVQLLYAKRMAIDDLTRISLSIGLSLTLVPLTGLVLNYTPFGIRLVPVGFSLSLLTITFLFLGMWRRHVYYKLAKGIL